METTVTKQPEGKHSLQIHKPQVTGKFCFQFDDDEPFELTDIYDSGDISLKLGSPQPKEGEEIKDSEISFEKNGKRFRIFIKPV